MPTEQERIWWLGEEGKRFSENLSLKVDPKERASIFRELIGKLPVKKILEVGCNRGHNLVALDMIGSYELHGIDPNEYALGLTSCKAKLTKADAFNIPYPDSYFDLVFTCVVLMHITTQDLPKTIQEICRVSNKYVLIIEYSSPLDKRFYDDFWDVAMRWKGIDYLVMRNYKDIIPGYIADGPVDMKPLDKNFLPHWWLFELDKKNGNSTTD